MPHSVRRSGKRPNGGSHGNENEDNNNNINNNDARPQKKHQRRSNKNTSAVGGAAASLPPIISVSAAMKREQKQIIEARVRMLLDLRDSNVPHADKYGKAKEIMDEAELLYGSWLTADMLHNKVNYQVRKRRAASAASAAAESIDISSSNESNNTNSSDNNMMTTSSTLVAAAEVSMRESNELPPTHSNASTPTSMTTESSTTTHSSAANTTNECAAQTNTAAASTAIATAAVSVESNESSHPPQDIPRHANACSFDNCTCASRPPKSCSESGCTMTVHKLCQLNYRNDQGIDDDDEDAPPPPLRCKCHEIELLWPSEREVQSCQPCQPDASADASADVSADDKRPAINEDDINRALQQSSEVTPNQYSHEDPCWQNNNADPTTSSATSSATSSTTSSTTRSAMDNATSPPVQHPNVDMSVGCDWRDVVDGGCKQPNDPTVSICGLCKKNTHHLCHLNYQQKCGVDEETLQVRCSNCILPVVVRHGSSSNTIPSPPQQQSETSSSSESNPATSHQRKKGGRPKGVTIAGEEKRAKTIALMTDYLAAKVKAAKQESADGKLRQGMYSKLHQETLEHFEMQDQGVEILYDTIKHRIQRGNTAVPSMGPQSPLARLEPFLVDIVKQAQEAGYPMTPSYFVELVNSLLENSEVKEELREYNIKRRLDPDTPVTKSYYNGFMKRNDLFSNKGTRKSTMRMDDMTADNVQLMYNLVYQRMIDAGVAVILPDEEHYYINSEGQVTTDESERFGELCTQKIVHREYVLMADEVGSDMCQEEDGAIGGSRYISDNKMSYLRGCKNSHRFTVFAITAGTGEIVMYVIIFAAKQMSFISRFGLDLRSETKYDKDKPLEEQVGAGMPFPGAPKTTFRGVEMEAFITHNESGSMTGDILAQVLQRIDGSGIYSRTEHGPRPFFLVDAHGSRLTYQVLKYANTEDQFGRPLWFLTIGLPNATELWQLGDQSEQNGMYKMDLTREKQLLMQVKARLEISQYLARSDILPILHRVLPTSFGDIASNVRALIRLGWFDMNRALMHDPRVMQRLISSSSASESGNESFESIEDMGLNVLSGVAGEAVLDYCQQFERNKALQKAREDRRRAAAEANGNLDHIRGKISGGEMYKSGTAACDGNLLARIGQKAQEKADKLYAITKKKAVKYDAMTECYEKLLTSGKREAKYSCKDMKAYITVRRIKEDGSIPSKKDELKGMMSRLANRQQLSLEEHLLSHTNLDEDQVADFLRRYDEDDDVEEESGDGGDDADNEEEEAQEECDADIGQREEI